MILKEVAQDYFGKRGRRLNYKDVPEDKKMLLDIFIFVDGEMVWCGDFDEHTDVFDLVEFSLKVKKPVYVFGSMSVKDIKVMPPQSEAVFYTDGVNSGISVVGNGVVC